MTQNIVTLDTPTQKVEVMVGWDRRCQEYFCSVFPLDAALEDAEDEEIDMPFRFPEGIPQIREALSKNQLSVPEIVFEKTLEDGNNNAGNIIRRFTAQGVLIMDTEQGLGLPGK